jgi:polyhydroxybutyrate depolymerase
VRRRLALLAVALLAGACGEPEPRPAAVELPASPCTAPEGPRTVLLAEPAERDGPAPLVVSLHGHGGNAHRHEATTGLAAAGTERGMVVATPQAEGDPRRWNFDRRPDEADDFAFLDALVGHLVATGCADPDRIHLVGSSNGAALAGLAACRSAHPIASVAMVIATVPVRCPEPSVLTIRGTADAHVPYEGIVEAVAADAAHRRCAAEPAATTVASGLEQLRWTGCPGGREVVLVTVVGGTHAWPAGATDVVLDRAAAAP